MRSILTIAALAFGLAGCSTLAALTGSPATSINTQQATLDGAKTALAAADTEATACITSGVSVCITNKAAIQHVGAVAFQDVQNAQTAITAGSDASTLLGSIQAEITTLQTLIK